MSQEKILNIAFYLFTDIQAPIEMRDQLRKFCAAQPIKGTMLLAREGINGMISGEEPGVRALQAHLRSLPEFKDLTFKESWSDEISFARMLVKVKKEIIPMGLPEVRPTEQTGARLLPKELKKWLDEKRDIIVVDTRNDYEVEVGTFESAYDMKLKNFREFPEKLKELPAEVKEKPVVMFCTGGIRCEKATALAVKEGFREVYQLEGGILKYFEEVGGDHYRGDCFVFDKRVALDPKLQAKPEHPAATANGRKGQIA